MTAAIPCFAVILLMGVPGGKADAGSAQDEKLGKGDFRFLMRWINADFASPQPEGKQSQILHSASLAA
ncbi:hypothetical protein [Plesiomonas shigelloides]|uniref:hypothetical protein n=1 Tax=Plesiomonas shigelloides TaxID=703 RepID=UPI001C49A099|nr:hypothetical protein [Plesiomonas shigelloides]